MIDYAALAKAREHYESIGFDYVEVPWRVSREIVNLTLPPGVEPMAVGDKVLIGSGEQGFLYQWSKGFLPNNGRGYQTITPCFRPDPHDETHQKQFMKLELFAPCESLALAQSFYDQISSVAMATLPKIAAKLYGIDVLDLTYDNPHPGANETMLNSVDIVGIMPERGQAPIELGSYGIRECLRGYWVYGTGLAEPRFSTYCRTINRARKTGNNDDEYYTDTPFLEA